MKLRFTKMNGLGNDFVVAEWPRGVPLPSPERIRAWADRRRGIGFDQLLLLEPETPPDAAASYRIYNADGGEVEQCGNGVRCLASFLAPSVGGQMTLASPAGMIAARVDAQGSVSVDLGGPRFSPESLPFAASEERDRYRLTLPHGAVEFGAVSMGNPHIVIDVDSVDSAPVGILGQELATHPAFPNGVNVGFMQRENRERIKLRVFERGVGETLACGTGAAAAVAVGRRWGELESTVEVELPGGALTVSWQGPGSSLWQTGPATPVYEGEIEI